MLIQALVVVSIGSMECASTFLLQKVVKKTVGIRVSEKDGKMEIGSSQ